MAELNLSKYGISGTTEIVHNPSYEMLFAEETKPGLEGYEVGQVSELGAVNVMTGIYTGRSPKDKYIVVDDNSKDTVWWTSDAYKNDNHPMSEQVWSTVKEIAVKELCNKRLFVVDAFCGANKDTRMAVRFIVDYAGQNGTVKVLVSEKYGQVLGVHAIGGCAGEFICAASAMVGQEMTTDTVLRIVFPHPTVSESIREAVVHA